MKKISIEIEGNEVYSLDDADVHNCFKDLWLIKYQLENLAYQGIESDNITKLRVGAGEAITDANGGKDKAIADTYGNRFYKLTFNNYSKVIESMDVNAKYNVSAISLEYNVTNVELAQMIKNQYSGKMAILYDRVLRHRIIPLNKKNQT